jgi:hypothetical protein
MYFKPVLHLWYPDKYFCILLIPIQLRKQSDNDENVQEKIKDIDWQQTVTEEINERGYAFENKMDISFHL